MFSLHYSYVHSWLPLKQNYRRQKNICPYTVSVFSYFLFKLTSYLNVEVRSLFDRFTDELVALCIVRAMKLSLFSVVSFVLFLVSHNITPEPEKSSLNLNMHQLKNPHYCNYLYSFVQIIRQNTPYNLKSVCLPITTYVFRTC